MAPDWVIVACIVRPRGVRGEVVADAANWTAEQIPPRALMHVRRCEGNHRIREHGEVRTVFRCKVRRGGRGEMSAS